jgi:hypothetical protein
MRVMNFVIKGYEQLRLNNIQATKPVTLTIETEMRCIQMPQDCLKFVSIGTIYNGAFYHFRPKSDMVKSFSSDCGVDTRYVPDQTDETRFIGYYSIDLENRRIFIEAPLALTEVVLNYTPTGINIDGETYIPRVASRVVQTFAEHQLVLHEKGATLTDKALFEKEYLKALNLFCGSQYNYDEIMNEYYEYIVTGKQY